LGGFRDAYRRIMDEVRLSVIGQDRTVELLLTCVLAEGHAILTGMPGLGRTLIAETLGQVLGLAVRRIQFTPDLLPTDITGTEVIDSQAGRFHYRFLPGPVFANMVLADEINRSPARTQAALLEAMQEKQVTANGKRYPLHRPFLVIATQNAVDTEGVYPLPEAQLDRFLMKIEVKYPSEDAEVEILDATTSVHHSTVSAVVSPATVVAMQQFARVIPVGQTVKEFAVSLVRATRWEPPEGAAPLAGRRSQRYWWGGLRAPKEPDRAARYLRWGSSPRAGQALLRAAKVRAIVGGRAYVTREDILDAFQPVMAHRVIVDHRAGGRGMTSQKVLDALVDQVCAETAPQPTSSRMKALLLGMKRR
jgi:MoxR-like ATPase